MPVELTDEQIKNQIKETLEKLTNKGGKSKGAKYRKEKDYSVESKTNYSKN
jgi:translation initiation factor IF-2